MVGGIWTERGAMTRCWITRGIGAYGSRKKGARSGGGRGCGMSCAEDMGVGNAAIQSGIDGECEILNQGDADAPSPSIIASRSFAIEKSPSELTAVTFGSGGMVRCSPGGNA